LQVLDRLLVAQADRIVANSRFTAAAVRRIYRRDADAIIDLGVGPEAFPVLHLPRDCILSLGSLIRFKRVDLAVEGYAIARRALGDALPPLVIVGDGPEAPALRALVTRLRLNGRVCFRGRV